MSEEPWTILRVLTWTQEWFAKQKIESPRLDAELILAHALGVQRVMLYAKFDQPLGAEELAKIRGLVARRARGEPVAYLLGQREFWSLPFEVSPAVLVPRPDTEVLVEVALSLARASGAVSLADVGTGSGCVAIALLSELPSARCLAVDVSAPALAIAQKNAAANGVADRLTLREGDLLEGVTEVFDGVVANLPYIRTGEIPRLMREVRDHEPRLALDGGADGLDLVRRLVASLRARLAPGGFVALEAGHDQLGAAARLLAEAGMSEVTVRKDYGGLDRVASARAAW